VKSEFELEVDYLNSVSNTCDVCGEHVEILVPDKVLVQRDLDEARDALVLAFRYASMCMVDHLKLEHKALL
jgi:hypothetical protein